MQALIAWSLIGDFRAPDILRFGLPALYVSHQNVGDTADILHHVLASEAWRDDAFQSRATVT